MNDNLRISNIVNRFPAVPGITSYPYFISDVDRVYNNQQKGVLYISSKRDKSYIDIPVILGNKIINDSNVSELLSTNTGKVHRIIPLAYRSVLPYKTFLPNWYYTFSNSCNLTRIQYFRLNNDGFWTGPGILLDNEFNALILVCVRVWKDPVLGVKSGKVWMISKHLFEDRNTISNIILNKIIPKICLGNIEIVNNTDTLKMVSRIMPPSRTDFEDKLNDSLKALCLP